MNEKQQYNNLSDRELARLFLSGDEDAAVTLISRYLPLVRSRASAFASAGDSFEDLCQEGTIGLLAAMRGYDPEKSSFATFARLCIDRVLISAERLKTRRKNIPENSIIAIDGDEDDNLNEKLSSGDVNDPEAIIIRREDYMRLMLKVANELTPLESKVLNLYVSGNSYGEIAKRLDISSKAVDNALQRIRRKLK